MNRVKLKLIAVIMKRLGVPASMSYNLYSKIMNDFRYYKNSSIKERFWSYKRGFLISSTKAFGLTPNNYKQFISDLDFYRLYPIDKQFKNWIDDKLTMKYILSPYNAYLPKYFCMIKKGGNIIPLKDGNNILSLESLMRLIKQEQQVALKMMNASSGVGFFKLAFNEQYELDNQLITEVQCFDFLKSLDNYLVTEYVVAHSMIRHVSSGALNTVRIMVINEDAKHPKLANSVVKFSTKASGQVDNIKAGSVYAYVNVATGEYSDAKNIRNNICFSCKNHPDSNIEIKGVLPNWQAMSEKLIEISQHLSPLSYLGYDIAITEDSFKIIEINSHQGIMMFQTYGPLLSDNIASDFFNKAINNIKR